ncbi:trypsin-like serine protease with C-terminal PDZ domain [Chthonomonas calidirosea]|uniref:S1C family serine protease n=1 Tax=Chthonomonas calidirosea TaxID=454171 RepID=UPI0006DD3C04|nr:S1C family serine protease [Chthonomonas calidirosea]CEK19094.1 trypsin-like serine protease with C-terminal PDZ domain [Chthonomonas calidirosea]
MRRKRFVFVALLTLLVLGRPLLLERSFAAPQSPPPQQGSSTDTHILQELSDELAQLISKTRVCVVTIRGWARPFGGPDKPPFPPPQGFSPEPGSFPFFSPGPPPPPKGRDFKSSKPTSAQADAVYANDMPPIRLTGSGFFIQKDLVVTTAEVVGCMAHPIVITDSGKWVPAVGMNVDYKHNVAVLRLPRDTDVPTLNWGEDSAAPPGCLVLVFGNQAGFSQVPTLGMVTAHNLWARSPDGRFHYNNLLQLQGVVGPGASGAPVIDAQAHVIGMVVGALNGPPNDFIHPFQAPGPPPNGAIDPMLGRITTIGFALPADTLKAEVAKLAVDIRPLPPLGWFGFIPGKADEHGIQIDTVFIGGPADVAGLRPGDWITAIDERPLRGRFEIPALSETLPVGQKLQIRAERDGKPFSTTLIVQARPDDQQLQQMQRLRLPHEEMPNREHRGQRREQHNP